MDLVLLIEWRGLEVEPGLFLVAAVQITLQLCIMWFGDLTNSTTRPAAVEFGVNAPVESDKMEMVSLYFKRSFTGTSMLPAKRYVFTFSWNIRS